VADEQPCTQLAFERRHLPAEGGLRKVERARGGLEATDLGDAEEVGEGAEVHERVR
jgi:hypothetical protein